MCSFRSLIIALTTLSILLACEDRAGAKEKPWAPPFDLHSQTADAELIVHGRLDAKGKLIVDAALKGKTTAKHLILTNGAAVFTALDKLEKQAKPIEVVVYLREASGKWEIASGEHGVVGFLGNGVYLVHEDVPNKTEAMLGRHATLLREPFLKSARAAVAALERRKVLLGLPASADRMEKFVSFLLELDPEGRSRHAYELSRALLPLARVEEKALIALLKSSAADSRVILLGFAGSMARGKVVFDAVADSLDSKQPVGVRRAAIYALASIDNYRVQERLIPLLDINEPELRSVIGVLGGSHSFHLNPAVVEPLRKLTEAVRLGHRLDYEGMADVSYALAGVLGHFAHPKLLPGLIEWAQADNHQTAGRAGWEVCRLTDLSPREDAHAWEKWWKKAKPLLEAKYDLRRAADRRKWYRAYRSGDVQTQRLLMRLWSYEPALDERGMVREAGGEGGDVAKIVLAALWKQQRLSNATKGDLVVKFLTVRLEEVPGQPIEPYRHLRIVGEKRFPFPDPVWVDVRTSIVIGDDHEPTLKGSFSTLSLGEEAKTQSLGTMSGGSYPGTPKARGILELRETTSNGDGKIVWKREWKLGPIRLQEAK